MKHSHSLFVLTVSMLFLPSNGDIFFLGQQQKHGFPRAINSSSQHFSSQCHPEFREPRQRRLWHLPTIRRKKNARFYSPKRFVSSLTYARKFIHGSNAHAVSIQDPANTKSLQGTKRNHFERFRFPASSRETIKSISSILRKCLIGVICLELVLTLKEAFEELFYNLDDEDTIEDRAVAKKKNEFRGASKKAFSKKSVEKLIAWLENPEANRLTPPPNVASDWQITFARELFEYSSGLPISARDVLLQLTTAEVNLLQQCWLSRKDKVQYSEIGGLYHIKNKILDQLSETLAILNDSVSSPYHDMISKDNRWLSSALWGPPGSGKTLMIKAIAYVLDWPTVVITPACLQDYQKLGALFSLVSTLEPCIVVLDNIEMLFPAPGTGNHGVATEIKAQFLQWWDEINSSEKDIFFVAATSYPWNVDVDVWKRFSNRYYVGAPNEQDRLEMLEIWSADLPPIKESVLEYFVNVTNGFMALDLKEALVQACRDGPMSRQDATLEIEDVRSTLASRDCSRTLFTSQYAQLLNAYMNSGASQLSTVQSQAQEASSISTAKDYFSPHIIQTFPFSDNGYCSETALGNYYQLEIPIDSEVLDAIRTLLLYRFERTYNEYWDLSEEDDDDDVDDDDDDDDDY